MAEWAKIDVGFFRHPQVCGLKPLEQLGYLAMILYAQEHETDGHVPASALRILGVGATGARAMHAAGLIAVADGGWHIEGFTRNQRTRAYLEREREANRKRAEDARRRKAERWAAQG